MEVFVTENHQQGLIYHGRFSPVWDIEPLQKKIVHHLEKIRQTKGEIPQPKIKPQRRGESVKHKEL